jgi:Flp pilus assembly protein TadG
MTNLVKTMALNRLCRCRSGAALVEFALVAPLLILLALGIFEFGRIIQSYHAIDKGVRDAARYLGRGFATCDNNGNGSFTNGTQAKNLALYGNTAGSGSVVLGFWSDPSTITITVGCVATSTNWISPNGGTYIPSVTVKASVTYTGFGFLNFLGLQSSGFTTQHDEMSIPE